MWKWLYLWSSPKTFCTYSKRIVPWLYVSCLLLLSIGCFLGLFISPPDYQQGDAFRIIYIHVPSAFLSLMIYAFMAFQAILVLVWQLKLSHIMIKVAAPIGTLMTIIALTTGSIWGKPMWGTWWIWDARLTSELILLFLYLGVIALDSAITDRQQAAKATAMVCVVGIVDLPIIHYSVYWWNTLHQGSTLAKFSQPSIAATMLWPLLLMILAFSFYFFANLLNAARYEVLNREKNAHWVKKYILELNHD